MPGLESQDTTIGRIDPSTLIGRPDRTIVEPRATAALTDAFRQGFITADDVISRVGELGKTKQKAELMGAQEAISPQAQAARAAQLSAATSTAQLTQAEAEKNKIYNQYPAVKYFDALAPTSGIAEPKLPDGTPDYKQMEQIGAELAVAQAKKTAAKAERDNIDAHFDADNRIVAAFTKQGTPVDPKHVVELEKIINTPFSRQAPGTATPTVEPKLTYTGETGAATPEVRARLTATLGADAVAGLDDLSVKRLDEAERAKAAVARPNIPPTAEAAPAINAVPPVGTPVAGGYSLGAKPPVERKTVDPVKRAQDLAASQGILKAIDSAKTLVNEPGNVGPAAGSGPVVLGNRLAAAFGIRTDEYENQRELDILINKKILEGAQIMKGNLSDKDVRFLKDSVPKLSDTPALWNTFLNNWSNLTQQNIAALGGTPGAAAVTEPSAPATTNSPIVTVPSGKKLQRDANGVYHYVQ